MAGKRRKEVTERQITGLKYFDKLAPLLERLHDDGCARDRAGNRELHYDQYCMLMLLYLFNPIVTSLRAACSKPATWPRCKRSWAARGRLWARCPRLPAYLILIG